VSSEERDRGMIFSTDDDDTAVPWEERESATTRMQGRGEGRVGDGGGR
jgi:hypothetical protein